MNPRVESRWDSPRHPAGQGSPQALGLPGFRAATY